jgi:hypothetical protein
MLPQLPPLSGLRSERGFTLVELLVAMITGLVVSGAFLAIIEFSQRQETRISDHVQADRSGRVSLERIQEQLHSSCVGDMSPIQGYTETGRTYTGLEGLNGTNLWFVSTYGTSESGESVLKHGFLHDINWTEGSLSNTGEKTGTLTDYAFENEKGDPPYQPWGFTSTLSKAKATTTHVLATNVTPLTGGTTLFHYFKYDTTSGSAHYGELEEMKASELPPVGEAASYKVAQVKVEYQQAPEGQAGQKADTRAGHTTTVSGSVVLRFSPSETTEEGTNTCS